jgi:DNA-directed RNA polymerase specialized sigma subunit
LEIPWDCISDKKRQVIKLYLYEQKDFLHIAKQMGLYNQASSKYEFYTALTKLSKIGTIRKFVKDNWESFSDYHKSLLEEAFINNKSYVQIAKDRNITPQGVQQVITRILKKNKVKWQTYIYRKKGKLYYNVPAILK